MERSTQNITYYIRYKDIVKERSRTYYANNKDKIKRNKEKNINK